MFGGACVCSASFILLVSRLQGQPQTMRNSTGKMRKPNGISRCLYILDRNLVLVVIVAHACVMIFKGCLVQCADRHPVGKQTSKHAGGQTCRQASWWACRLAQAGMGRGNADRRSGKRAGVHAGRPAKMMDMSACKMVS